jgi:hypothetical protein
MHLELFGRKSKQKKTKLTHDPKDDDQPSRQITPNRKSIRMSDGRMLGKLSFT